MNTILLSRHAIALFATALLLATVSACKKDSSTNTAQPKEAAAKTRYDWNLDTLVTPYENAGFAGPAWDEPAKRALTEFARVRAGIVEPNEPWAHIIATNCAAAIEAGCQDPMIAYLSLRYPVDDTRDAKVIADEYCKVGVAMNQSSYPPVRKFYVSRRAWEQFYRAYGSSADRSAIRKVGSALAHVEGVLADPEIPVEEAYEICLETLDARSGTTDPNQYLNIYLPLERAMLQRWPDDYRSWLLKGTTYIKIAWLHRGSGYAQTVSEQGWEGLRDNLAVAEEALEKAWELNQNEARIPYEMLRLELGQGRGRERMELWFSRAMTIDTNFYNACERKLFYLEPKWYGSEAMLLAFGRECIESKQWGGTVPLVILDAHTTIAGYLDDQEAKTNYWKRAEVWLDIEDAFERFFELNPNAVGWYHNYAWYARRSERWDKVNELIPKLSQPINYSYFGGRDEFDRMVATAKARASETPPARLSLEIELDRLNARIANNVDMGRETEGELAAEMGEFDRLLAKYESADPEARALLLLSKAAIYLQLLGNTDEAKRLAARVKADYPETKAGGFAEAMLAQIHEEEAVMKIRSALIPGKPFPDFTSQDLSGQPLSVAKFKGKVVLVDFWATWCGPCVAELPNVLKTYEKHHDRGFEVVGISLDDDREKLETFIKQKSMPWPQHFDGKGWESELAAKYGVNSIPATFLLDRTGNIIATDLRGEDLEKAVAKALAGE